MLLCKDQKREFIIEGKKIRVSDKYLNAYFAFHDMLLDAIAISVFFSAFKNNMSKQDVISAYAEKELSGIIETSIKAEISGLMQDDFDAFWTSVPE